MDPMVEEQLDYGEDEFGVGHKLQHQGSAGTIPALANEGVMGEDDDYDDLYNDVNVGDGFTQTIQQHVQPSGQKSNGNVLPVSQPGGVQKPTGVLPAKNLYQYGSDYKGSPIMESNGQSHGYRGNSLAPRPPNNGIEPKFGSGRPSVPSGSSNSMNPSPMPLNLPPASADSHLVMDDNPRAAISSIDNSGPTVLFVGELHWWTTDAELESVLSRYGRVREIKFFDERASGKSKGYCQVEFYGSASAAACKEGMKGHVFNGRPCVVAFASPESLKQMVAVYPNRSQAQAQSQPQGRRQMSNGLGRGGGANHRGNDRTGWGRGGQALTNRGQGGAGPMRGRGVIGAKAMVGGAVFGGPIPGGVMHPQGMLGSVFDQAYMVRGGGPYGGFPTPGFPGMVPPFQAVNAIGFAFAGVAPHVNPAFFARGISANVFGMIGGSGTEGPSMGTGRGEEHGRKKRESSYGDDVADHGYEESNQGRERHREDMNAYGDHRPRDSGRDDDDGFDRGQSSSGSRSRSRITQEEDHRSRSGDADYGKRRRGPSE